MSKSVKRISVLTGGGDCPGLNAFKLLAEGTYNRMVAMQHGELAGVAIAEVADQQRLVLPDNPLLAACRATGVSFGD